MQTLTSKDSWTTSIIFTQSWGTRVLTFTLGITLLLSTYQQQSFFSDTLHRSCLCQPIPSSRLSGTVIFFGSWIEYGKRQSSVCSLLSAHVGHICHLLQCRRGSLHTNPQWHAVIFQNKALLTIAHNFRGKTLHHKQQKEKSGSLVLKN